MQQNLNLAGIGLFLHILGGNQQLALPHLSVTDITEVNWDRLKQAGFKGVVFDKDNTLTRPFQLQVEPKLLSAVERCRLAFGSAGMALLSNSAGLTQYDPQGHEATQLESSMGMAVIRHSEKKPSGGAVEVAAHFGCQPHELVMVGDRYLTDVVFGNRHGMLTIRPLPLELGSEPTGVVLARRVEEACVARWTSQGLLPAAHPLIPHSQLSDMITPPVQPPPSTSPPAV